MRCCLSGTLAAIQQQLIRLLCFPLGMSRWAWGGLGGLTTPLCKAGGCLAQARNLERWVSQADTLPLHSLPRSRIKMRKPPDHNASLRSSLNSRISVCVSQDVHFALGQYTREVKIA